MQVFMMLIGLLELAERQDQVSIISIQ